MASEIKLPKTPAYNGQSKPFERMLRDAVRATTGLTAPTTPLARLGAIRGLAHYAQVQEALGDHCSRSECLPIPDREEKLREADLYYDSYEKAVRQLVALICDDEAIPHMDMIEAQCAVLGD